MGCVILWPATGEKLHRPDGVTEGYDLSGATVIEVADDFSWQGTTIDWDHLSIVQDIAALRAAKWEDVKALRYSHANGGCETPLGRVDTDDGSRNLINGAVQMAQQSAAAGIDFELRWTMADNSIVLHDGPAMIAMGMAVGMHVAHCWAVSQALQTAIDAATTIEELDAIDITAGWPGGAA